MDNSTHIPADTAVEPTEPAKAAAPVRASFGERAFNWMTYGVWNHGVNLVLSTLLALNFKGSKSYHNVIAGVKKLGIQDTTAAMITDISLLSMGGHITALGVKPLEDHKSTIVSAINARLSPKEADAPLADERKQTWLSVLGARIFTLAVAVVSFSGLKGLLGNNEKNVPRIDAFQDRTGRKLAGMTKAGKAAADVTTTMPYRLGSLLSLEVIIVTLMSTLFYFSSKLLSKKQPDLLPVKVKPQVSANMTMAEDVPEEKKTNFAERIRAQETAESLDIARA